MERPIDERSPTAEGSKGGQSPRSGSGLEYSRQPHHRRHRVRQQLGLGEELILAAVPALLVLLVGAFMWGVTMQAMLLVAFTSSAFLIYLDPRHRANSIVAIVVSYVIATLAGLVALLLLGPGYASAALALVAVVVTLVALGAVHPPAVAMSLVFAFRSDDSGTLTILALVAMATAAAVLTARLERRILARMGE